MRLGKLDLTGMIKKFDTDQVGLSIASLKNQITDAAGQFPRSGKLPKRNWNKVIFCAMGGSGLGADFIRSVYAAQLSVPVIIEHEYKIPSYADAQTLIVICSYSGTTEEMISCFKEALLRKIPTFVIAEGGALAMLAKKHHIPAFVFKPRYNPSNQPRLGTGYTMTGLYMVLKKKGLLKGGESLLAASKHMSIDPIGAARFAQKTLHHSFIIISAEHLQGNAHVMSNQMNECAKVFAPHYFLSELNHHLLEGLGSLKNASRHWTILFLESSLYSKKIQRRIIVTKQVLRKQGFACESIQFAGNTVEQGLRTLMFGSWVSYYQAIMLKLNPVSIPWVDYFKKQL